MKKVSLSIAVILAFIFYSWHQQNEIAQAPVIGLPVQSKNNTTATPSSSSSPSSPLPTSATLHPTGVPTTVASGYKDGTYTGSAADAFYGNIQVQLTIANGKINDVQFLQYPNDRGTSISINTQAMPLLKSEAISGQTANVDIISGATDSSQAFIQSMQSALDQAKA